VNRNILAAFSLAEDRRALQHILGDAHRQLHFTSTFAELQTALRTSLFAVAITDSQLRDGCRWTDVLAELQSLPYPPPLIVADPLADDSLWAEVLNLGAFDLLAKPFEAREVLHAVNSACCRFASLEHARDSLRAKPAAV